MINTAILILTSNNEAANKIVPDQKSNDATSSDGQYDRQRGKNCH
jgi:hypothetical protein